MILYLQPHRFLLYRGALRDANLFGIRILYTAAADGTGRPERMERLDLSALADAVSSNGVHNGLFTTACPRPIKSNQLTPRTLRQMNGQPWDKPSHDGAYGRGRRNCTRVRHSARRTYLPNLASR